MKTASSHSGHFTLERHRLIDSLRDGNFRREQVAQFFKDRIYILEIIESIVDLGQSEESSAESWSQLPAEQKIFSRAHSYREELKLLVGQWSSFQPSEAAINYGDYLETARPEVVSLHLWLFLIGETFGAQHISGYIAKTYPQVGAASKDFEGMKLMTVRGVFNTWIDQQLANSSLEQFEEQSEMDYSDEIGVAYSYMTELFDAAYGAPRLSAYQSAVSALSRILTP